MLVARWEEFLNPAKQKLNDFASKQGMTHALWQMNYNSVEAFLAIYFLIIILPDILKTRLRH